MKASATRNGVSFWHVASVLGGSERSFLDLVGASIPVSKIYLPDDGPLAKEIQGGEWSKHLDFFKFPARLRKLSRTQGIWNLLLIPLSVIALLQFFREANRKLRRDQPRIIYSHGLKLHILLTPIAWWQGIPIVWHLQDFWPNSLLWKVLLQIQYFFGFVAICDSKAVAEALPLSGEKKKRVFVVHNAIDLNSYPFYSTESREKSLVGFVGMMTQWKGPEVFLEAATKLQAEPYRFLLAGGMPYDADQADKEFFDRLKSQECSAIQFTGLLSDPRPIFQKIEVFCHCSIRPEPFGRVILEAMASGAIVIVADSGGPKEIVRDGIDGFLCPPGNADALAEKIRFALSLPPEERQKILESARSRVEREFSSQKFQKEILQILRPLGVE